MLYALSYALDCIEGELLGVHTGHGKWVAYLSVRMGKQLGLAQNQLLDLAACATLHDNALTQYVLEERAAGRRPTVQGPTAVNHCILGEQNVRNFPFRTDVAGVILYHHENADGSGYFAKTADDTPLLAQLIHFADLLDLMMTVQQISAQKYQDILDFVKARRDTLFDARITTLFPRAFPKEFYLSLAGRKIDDLLEEEIPETPTDYSFAEIKSMMDVFGKIIDNKSPFTRSHSEQIAKRVWEMAGRYGYDERTRERLYVAGSLHDIGKMAIPNAVLEKPGKLDAAEFACMQKHALYSYEILSRIRGFGDITKWAAHHHEKLNGKGYPFGLTGAELDEKERLMACVDIYQALSEARPYKPGLSHENAWRSCRVWRTVALLIRKLPRISARRLPQCPDTAGRPKTGRPQESQIFTEKRDGIPAKKAGIPARLVHKKCVLFCFFAFLRMGNDLLKRFIAQIVLHLAGVLCRVGGTHAQELQKFRELPVPCVDSVGNLVAGLLQRNIAAAVHRDVAVLTQIFHGNTYARLGIAQRHCDIYGANRTVLFLQHQNLFEVILGRFMNVHKSLSVHF
jgi:HD-GYP domain-containing protein (c-di-GMP phosphodiesterase class II)